MASMAYQYNSFHAPSIFMFQDHGDNSTVDPTQRAIGVNKSQASTHPSIFTTQHTCDDAPVHRTEHMSWTPSDFDLESLTLTGCDVSVSRSSRTRTIDSDEDSGNPPTSLPRYNVPAPSVECGSQNGELHDSAHSAFYMTRHEASVSRSEPDSSKQRTVDKDGSGEFGHPSTANYSGEASHSLSDLFDVDVEVGASACDNENHVHDNEIPATVISCANSWRESEEDFMTDTSYECDHPEENQTNTCDKCSELANVTQAARDAFHTINSDVKEALNMIRQAQDTLND